MGAICAKHGRKNPAGTKVSDENNAAPAPAAQRIFMIVVALDYEGTGNELTCTQDGDNLWTLIDNVGVPRENVITLYNNDGNKEQVEQAIAETGAKCQAGDVFFFYYSGHGAEVADQDGDEEDGQDEALCLVTLDGELDWSKFMTDDEFCDTVTEHVSEGVEIIIVCDCCHSGTIGDFKNEKWAGHSAVSISGCRDSQTSGDTGTGGICTHSMLMAVAEFQAEGTDHYSIGQFYNKVLDKDDSVFDSKQDITLNWTDDCSAGDFVWPLIPKSAYQAPWGQ